MTRPDQALAVDQRDRDPSVSRSAADEKGGLLFTFLDGKFGRERFDAFLKGYFDHFAFKSITTEEFLGYLRESLLDRFPGIVSASQVAAWVEEPGLPPEAPLLAAHPYEPVDTTRSAWLAGKVSAKKLDTRGWVTPQWTYFLDGMPGPLRRDQLADLDQAFGFTRTANAEIASSWFVLVIKSAYQPSYHAPRGVPRDQRAPDAARAGVRRAHEDAGRRSAREARVCARTSVLPGAHRRRARRHREPRFRYR